MAASFASQKYKDLSGVLRSESYKLTNGVNRVELLALSASGQKLYYITPSQRENVLRSRQKDRRPIAGTGGDGTTAPGIQVREPEFTAHDFISRAFKGARTIRDPEELQQLLCETGRRRLPAGGIPGYVFLGVSVGNTHRQYEKEVAGDPSIHDFSPWGTSGSRRHSHQRARKIYRRKQRSLSCRRCSVQ